MSKNQFRFFLLFFCLIYANQILVAQNQIATSIRLAKQAYNNEEFEKAIDYYEDLYKKTNSDTYYNSLVELYPKADRIKDGEKMIKKRIRKFPMRTEFLVDLGHYYELQEDDASAKKQYEEAISKIDLNNTQTRLLTNKFKVYKKYKYIEEAYLKARRINGDNRLFQFELANNYAEQGKTEEMVNEYLTILGENNGYKQTVQNLFQRYLRPDPEGKQMAMLREQLLRKIQREPRKEIFSELLIWLYIQDKNFKGAYLQAKALDRRKKEDGVRLHKLAQLSLANKEFAVAEKSFNYVISIGKEGAYYKAAKLKMAEVKKLRVLDQKDYTKTDLLGVRATFLSTIEDLGKNSFSYPLMSSLADLEAFYLDDLDSAIMWNSLMIELPSLSKHQKAESKLALGDLLLVSNEIWEASLLYSQVDKDFKYDQLGETAKLKNAKIAFYTGDFYWAQAQLDVLKGSTSKLIANDAMDLSLTITDNIGLDSIAEPLEMYARADRLNFKKDYSLAHKTLDSIPEFFPASSLKDDILFLKYEMEYAQRNYDTSSTYLRSLLADYAEDILGDDALFELALMEQEIFKNTVTARDFFKQLITTYPASIHVVESRKRFRLLRGDNLENPKEIN